MEITSLGPSLANLSDTITQLESALSPLLSNPSSPNQTTALTTQASTLPLLDQAKLYILSTYALESLLFSALTLSGADAKKHAVFAELARVKAYFGKIAAVEAQGPGAQSGPRRRNLVDREAAGRIVRFGVTGNERVGVELRKGAKRKLEQLGVVEGEGRMHVRFEEEVEEGDGDGGRGTKGDGEEGSDEEDETAATPVSAKSQKGDLLSSLGEGDSASMDSPDTSEGKKSRRKRRRNRHRRGEQE